jgi:hypothetical protein
LTAAYQKSDGEKPAEAARRAIVERIGVLLGYPRCCSRAFAAAAEWEAGSNEWLWLSRRLAHPGRIPQEMHPFAVEHVPCSAACAETIARTRQVLGVMEKRSARLHSLLSRALSRPLLILLDAAGLNKLEIRPETPPSARFRYGARASAGLDPRLRQAAQGDEMLLEEGCVTILRRGKEHAFFPANAFLWWSEAAFHREFWRPCVALKLRARVTAAREHRGNAAAAAPASAESVRLKRVLAAIMLDGDRAARLFAGFRVGRFEESEKPRVELTLEDGSERILLSIEKAEEGKPSYAVAGGYAIRFSTDTPLDSDKKKDAVGGLARYLARAWSRCDPTG